MDIVEIYLLNLLVTAAMFLVLIFRAWIELKNYRIMWNEMRFKQTAEAVYRVLKAEKDLFTRMDGGQELYDLLCRIFETY